MSIQKLNCLQVNVNETLLLYLYDVIKNNINLDLNPINKSKEALLIRSLLCILALLTNSCLIKFMSSAKNLFNCPRSIFQLILIFCNMLSTLVNTLKIVYSFRSNDDLLCRILVFVGGLPSQLFYLNLSIALIDRYLAMKKTALKYRQTVTIKRIVICVPILNLILILLLKWVFISGLAPLTCSHNLGDIGTFGVTLFIQFVCCLMLNLHCHCQEVKLRLSRPPTLRMSAIGRSSLAQQEATGMDNDDRFLSRAQLERQEARTLIISTIILLPSIAAFIILTFFVTGYVCDTIYWSMVPYFHIVIDLHSILHPMWFLYRIDLHFCNDDQINQFD